MDADAAATLRADAVDAFHPGDLGPRDIVATDDAVVASFDGLRTTVERLPAGEWSPSPRDFRALPRGALGLQAVVVVLAATALAAGAVRWRRDLAGWLVLSVVTIVSAAVALLIVLAAMRSRPGVLPIEVFVAVPLLPLLIACGLALMEPTRLWRSLTVGGRFALAIVLVAGIAVPTIPVVRWSATNAPSYRTATVLSVAVAAACALAAFLVGVLGTRRPDVVSSGLAAPPPRPAGPLRGRGSS